MRAASALQQCGTTLAARWHVTCARPPCLHLLRASSSWPAAASTTTNSSSSSSKRALHLFVCVTDAAADQAGAALVSALKQLHGGALQLTGVGGPLLQAQGLQSVVTDEQLQQLATAEVVPPVHSPLHHKMQGISQVSKHAYLKIFRDALWPAAFEGCGSVSKQPVQQQQGQQGQQQAATCFDAVLAISSPTAGPMLLEGLRAAERQKKARVPVVVQYTVPGLWDYQQAAGAATRWSKLADHVMCSLPFEPALLHAAGVPASFVGHSLMQPLLQSGSFSSRASLVAQLLQQQQQQATAAAASGSAAGQDQQQQQQQLGLDAQRMQQLFAKGDARSFWRVFNSLYTQQHPLAAVEPALPSSSSSPHKHLARPKQPPQPQQQQERVLLALLPGTTEAEVVASMAGFDRVTRELLGAHPGLVAAMVVPDVLVEAAIQATNNFALQVLVVPAGDKLAAGALAAAAAALAHPGHASLGAAAAGVPLVCVRDGSLLRDGWARWRRRRELPHGCIPNLLLGRAAVPEANLWQRGGLQLAVGALSELLTESASANSSSSNSSRRHLQEQQCAVLLGQLLLQLVPVASTASASGQQQQSGLLAVKSPAEAAAAALLELVQLRQQQEAQQLQAASSRNKGAPATTAGVGSSRAMQAASAAA